MSKPFDILSKILNHSFEISPVHVIVGRSSVHDLIRKSIVKSLGDHAVFPEDLSYIVERKYKSNDALLWFELPKVPFVQFAQTVIPAMLSKWWTPGIVLFTSDLEGACDVHAAFPMIKMSRSKGDLDQDDERASLAIARILEKEPIMAMKLLLDTD